MSERARADRTRAQEEAFAAIGGGGGGAQRASASAAIDEDLVVLLRALDLEHYTQSFGNDLMVLHFDEALHDVEPADLLSISVPPIAVRRFARWQAELRSGGAGGSSGDGGDAALHASQRAALLALVDSSVDEKEALALLLATSPCFAPDVKEMAAAPGHARRASALSRLTPRAASILAVLHSAGVVRLRHLAAEGEWLLPPGGRRQKASRRRLGSMIDAVDKRESGSGGSGAEHGERSTSSAAGADTSEISQQLFATDVAAVVDLQKQGLTADDTLQLVGEALRLEELRLLLITVRLKAVFPRIVLGNLPGSTVVRSIGGLEKLCASGGGRSAAELVAILGISKPALRRLQRALDAHARAGKEWVM
jgi:hypothetical protein